MVTTSINLGLIREKVEVQDLRMIQCKNHKDSDCILKWSGRPNLYKTLLQGGKKLIQSQTKIFYYMQFRMSKITNRTINL